MRPAEQLRYLVLAAQREGNRQLTAAMAALGVTPAQSEALRIITDHGPLSMSRLGEMLVCDTGANPSRIVDRLVRAGLVQRATDERDRRFVRLSATSSGRDAAAEIAAVENRIYDDIDRLFDPDDLATLIECLQTITRGSPAGQAFDNRLAAESAH